MDKYLIVEDGSVDIDKLEEMIGEDKIILYREGANPPFVVELDNQKSETTEILEETIYLLSKKLFLLSSKKENKCFNNEYEIEEEIDKIAKDYIKQAKTFLKLYKK